MRVFSALLCALLLLAIAAPAMAAEVQQGDTIVVGPDQVVNDDLYAFGSNVEILGTVNGDVFAAGNRVTVGGTVAGSVFAAGNIVSITADVGHGVHAAANALSIGGPVAGDATVATTTVNVAPGANIGRDLLMAAGAANVAAPVGRNVLASVGTLTLAAPVGGDVRARVTTLHLADSAQVDGSLTYTSENEATFAPGASVASGVQHSVPQAQSQAAPSPIWGAVDWLRGLVGPFVIGLLFLLLLPRVTANTLEVARTDVWSSLGIGFGLLVGVPIVALLMFVVGIIIGGWMLAFALLAIYAMACAVGYAFAAIFTGKLIVQALRQPTQHLVWNLVEGLAVLGLIGLIPIAGGVVGCVACIFGMGAFTLNVVRTYRQPNVVPVVPSQVTPVQPQLAAA